MHDLKKPAQSWSKGVPVEKFKNEVEQLSSLINQNVTQKNAGKMFNDIGNALQKAATDFQTFGKNSDQRLRKVNLSSDDVKSVFTKVADQLSTIVDKFPNQTRNQARSSLPRISEGASAGLISERQLVNLLIWSKMCIAGQHQNHKYYIIS